MDDQQGMSPTGMSSTGPELAAGTRIGNYEIQGIAGRGGMGVVYVAAQQRPMRTVAVKVIRPELAADPQFRQRFEREADVAASIEHTNVLPIYETGEQDGMLFLAMRYIRGTDLRRWLTANGPMEARRAAHIIRQVGKALDTAHVNGLVHRDVKPGNILLSDEGGEDHVYLTDFGLTKASASSVGFTKTGTWLGTVDYVAPEQIRGDRIDGRADVYSLGCVLFELLSGKVPFDRDSEVSKIFAHMNDWPPSLEYISPLLDQVIKRAMAKDPDERYASAGELGRAAIAAAENRAIDFASGGGPAAAASTPGSGPTLIERPPDSFSQPTPATPLGAGPPLATPAQPLAPPPLVQAPGTQAPPATPAQPAAPPPRRRRKLRWIFGGLGTAVLIAGAAVAVLLIVLGNNDAQAVKRTVTNFFTTSGPAACNYLSPANLNANFGGLSACQRRFANVTASNVTGTQQVTVTGAKATDTGFADADGHPLTIALVKQNGQWLIDSIDNHDTDAINRLIVNWAGATGGNVCNYFSQADLNANFGGSLANCRRQQSNNASFSVNPPQNVVYQSGTHATDTFTLSDGSHWKVAVSKQSNGTWLIDTDTKTSSS